MFTKLLNKTATINRKTFTQTSSGRKAETWAENGKACTRYGKNSAPKVVDGTYKTSTDEYIFYFNAGTDILREDQIVIDGKTFAVIGVATMDGQKEEHHMEVVASYHDHA